MKKFLNSEGFKAALLGFVFILILVLASWNDDHYTRTGKIYRVNPFSYKFVDVADHVWAFEINDIVSDGTPVKVRMNTKGTPTYIYDDEIEDYEILFDYED